MVMNLLRAGKQTAGASSLLPNQVSGLEAWYDATVGGSITVATGVSAWASQVGGLSVGQATTANQPANGANIKGKNALSFDGTDDSLADSSGSNLNWTTDKVSVFAAIQTPPSHTTIRAIVAKANNPDVANGGTKWSLKIDSTGHLTAEIGTTAIVQATSTFTLSTSTRYIVRLVYDGASISIATNVNAAETTAQTGNLCANGGAPMCIARAKYDSEWYSGLIGEVAVYSVAVTGANLTGLMSGLVSKWV